MLKNIQKYCFCRPYFLKKKFSFLSKPKNEKSFIINGVYKRYFYQCMKCNHMYAAHNIKISNIYTKQYFKLVYEDINGIDDRFKYISKLPKYLSDNKNRADRVFNFFSKKNICLLDVGSGTGLFLYEMKKKKWIVEGLDLDNNYVNYCKNIHNLKIYNSSLKNFINKKKYDVITFNKVLEHLKRPHFLLKESIKKLRINGIVYIEVPDELASKKGKERGEFGLEHYHVFSISSLNNLIEISGFKTIKIERIVDPSGKFTIYAFIKPYK